MVQLVLSSRIDFVTFEALELSKDPMKEMILERWRNLVAELTVAVTVLVQTPNFALNPPH